MKLSTRIRRLRRPKSIKQFIKYVIVAVISFALAGYVYASNSKQPESIGRLVSFHDRGEEHVILTYAQSVKDALRDANITLGPQDVVEPAMGTELLSSDTGVVIYRARQIIVVDGKMRQKVMTAAAAPSEIVAAAHISPLRNVDEATFSQGDYVTDGTSRVMTIKRASVAKIVKATYKPTKYALTKNKGAQLFTDPDGVTHRETYYDLLMNVVIRACGPGGYTVRKADGAKVDKDGYILVAANYNIYPRCSVVQTSMGPGKVYDTGGFALRYPHGFDLATDWSFPDGK